jgi:polyferredoxin
MPFLKTLTGNKYRDIYSFLLVAGLAIGGYFWPVLGLGILGLMVTALLLNFRKRRSFCAGVCPNGNFLAASLKGVSANRRVPRAFVDARLRRMLCGLMIFCLIGLISRGFPDVSVMGRAFWVVYIVALSVGLLIGIFYKPRAWCVICPLGTLQDTIGEAVKKH